MPVSPARAAAFDILLRVERESSYANELLHSSTFKNLSSQDHALTTELVMGVLRWRSRLDDEIAQSSSQPLKKLDLEILIAMRLAVYQFRNLTRIPQRAALHESVELVKRARKKSAAPFVNAVLRNLSATPTAESGPLCSSVIPVVKGFSIQQIATSYAHPAWLVGRWTDEYGADSAPKICAHNQSIPITTIRLRTLEVEGELAKRGIQLQPGSLLRDARRIVSGDITQTGAFRNDEVVIQDEASQLVAALVGRPEKSKARILDCCAAPGGKTLAIADANPNSEITAVEVHPHRARLMQKLWGASAGKIKTVVADARTLPDSDPYDRILADVPCSGTGTLARNPEIKWRLKPEDLPDLHDRQLAILSSALKHLAPGGRLIYSTCSLEKEENEDVIAQILSEDNSVTLLNCADELNHLKGDGQLVYPDPESLTRGHYLRTIPGLHPCDGFFAAILEKRL
ncbi:MAG TPA: 16S rRNA (cytosine(967)-C(5))-methyltransferase RsmB [Candidatus Eisenbacteria bacterium]|nr:16S rRNA (cytosine(967)-C(5))-methyltransferase RsmB [Candidatus Eisenbacteria bacterium]